MYDIDINKQKDSLNIILMVNKTPVHVNNTGPNVNTLPLQNLLRKEKSPTKPTQFVYFTT